MSAVNKDRHSLKTTTNLNYQPKATDHIVKNV